MMGKPRHHNTNAPRANTHARRVQTREALLCATMSLFE
jgi:hypothetical protein